MIPTAFALTVNDINPHKPRSRLHQDGQGLDINAPTEDVYTLIRRRGEILLTSTVIGKLYAIRVVVANQKSDEQHVHKAFAIRVDATEEVLRQRPIRDGEL